MKVYKYFFHEIFLLISPQAVESIRAEYEGEIMKLSETGVFLSCVQNPYINKIDKSGLRNDRIKESK